MRTSRIPLLWLAAFVGCVAHWPGFCDAGAAAPRMYRDRIAPHWFEGGTRFWHRNELPGGKEEFVVVNAETGERQRVDRAPDNGNPERGVEVEREARPTVRNGGETELVFDNRLPHPVELFWIDSTSTRRSYGKVEANSRRALRTFGGHMWLVAGPESVVLGVFEARENGGAAVIDASLPKAAKGRVAPNRREESRGESPDGAWRAFIRDHNLFVRSARVDLEIQLSHDGQDKLAYGNISWAPDSRSVAAFRTESAEKKSAHRVESSPPGGGRAALKSRPYVLPGDPFPKHELNIFNLEKRSSTRPTVDRFEHEWQSPRVHWSPDSSRLSYLQVDRGHQRFRVIEVEVKSGAVRNLIDERSDTFIWTAHTETLGTEAVNWLRESEVLIYVTERSGWRHLHHVDIATGEDRALTKGDWVVRGIDSIDEANRQVWFRASGVFAGQDPYLVHFGRVNFDGSGLVFLTRSDGNHSIQFSPDRRWIIDTYSRVDCPPAHELRRTLDGELVCKLDEADVTELEAAGFQPPEVFVAKGRDGTTDIWGVIYRPPGFDPNKKHPILEDIYAGPHGAFVPKSFSTQRRHENYGKLGFVVVKIDGMGTAHRSKAFHDACWKNLKDAGFEDRILWMKAAAAKHPELDISRVGIFGTSAGGQNAAGAVIFHPEFYKAAAANCGCHDNRMDKASWNEQWMGYPVGPQYLASSNIENAGKLGGALFLIVGELDTNVPPESTLRFADALIKAGKEFEMLVVPGAGHGVGGPPGVYVQRRVEDFFVRRLMKN